MECFNPCFIGSCSATPSSTFDNLSTDSVSILVLLEVALRRMEILPINQGDLVSILVLLEVALRLPFLFAVD